MLLLVLEGPVWRSQVPTGYGDPIGRLPCSIVSLKVRILARWSMTQMGALGSPYTRPLKLFRACGRLLIRIFLRKIGACTCSEYQAFPLL